MNCKQMMTRSARLAATCGLGLALAFNSVAAPVTALAAETVAADTQQATYKVYQVMSGAVSSSTVDGDTVYKITAGKVNEQNKTAIVNAINGFISEENKKLNADSANINAEFQDAFNVLTGVQTFAFH